MKEHEREVAAAFAAAMKDLRAATGLTMAQLGARCEPPMLAPAVSRYETGDRLPTWEVVVRLARAFGVTPDTFLPKVKPPPKPKKGRGKKT